MVKYYSIKLFYTDTSVFLAVLQKYRKTGTLTIDSEKYRKHRNVNEFGCNRGTKRQSKCRAVDIKLDLANVEYVTLAGDAGDVRVSMCTSP